ncbi:MAG TPA: Ger(x)C family spore germination protein [Bacillaceae bacterium]|nr:Ger(x)C family spore germination protein [Paenibacillus bovis]HLU22373.1 Ger(x)C family spore germination protein [Bacillaceae bacterium]
MSKTIIRLYFIILLFIPMLSGCWDSLDLEKRATILSIAIDKADPDANVEHITHFKEESSSTDQEMIRLTAQISVPGRIPLGPETGGGEKEPVWILTSYGHTLEDALLNLQQELADDLFLGHLRIIVISEELAKEGVERFNDYLRRQPEVRRTAWLAISKEEAAKYMDIAPKLERVPALYLTSMVSNAVNLGKFPNDTIGLFWRTLSSKGKDAYLPYLEIRENENVQINGLAYFKGDKMLGKIDPIEIGLYMAVVGEKEGGYGALVKIPGTNDEVLIRAVRRKSEINSKIKNGKPNIHVKIRYESEIQENESVTTELNNEKVLRQLEKQANKDTKKNVEKLINTLKSKESDVFGFGEYIRAKHPIYWKREIQTKENWATFYKDLDVSVEVDSHIRGVGIKAK